MQQFALALSHCSWLQNYTRARTETVCTNIAFCRLKIIPPLLSGRLPYRYGKSAKLLRPDCFLGAKHAKNAFVSAAGAYSIPTDPLAGLKAPTSKGRKEYEEDGRRGKAKEGGGMRKGRSTGEARRGQEGK